MRDQSLVFLIDSNRGIYVPQEFAERYRYGNVTEEQLDILRHGPETDGYWDTWDEVLQNAECTSPDGNVYRLWQDGDLWAYCEELMTDEEYKNFFGEERV